MFFYAGIKEKNRPSEEGR